MAQQMLLNSQTLVVGRYYIPLCLSAFFFNDRSLSALSYYMSLASISTFLILLVVQTNLYPWFVQSFWPTNSLYLKICLFVCLFWAVILVSFICLAQPVAVKMKLIFTLILETTLHSSLKKYTLGVLMFGIKIIPQMVVHFLRWEWGVRVI